MGWTSQTKLAGICICLHIFSTAIPFLVEFLSLEVSSSERNASFMSSRSQELKLILVYIVLSGDCKKKGVYSYLTTDDPSKYSRAA